MLTAELDSLLQRASATNALRHPIFRNMAGGLMILYEAIVKCREYAAVYRQNGYAGPGLVMNNVPTATTIGTTRSDTYVWRRLIEMFICQLQQRWIDGQQ